MFRRRWRFSLVGTQERNARNKLNEENIFRQVTVATAFCQAEIQSDSMIEAIILPIDRLIKHRSSALFQAHRGPKRASTCAATAEAAAYEPLEIEIHLALENHVETRDCLAKLFRRQLASEIGRKVLVKAIVHSKDGDIAAALDHSRLRRRLGRRIVVDEKRSVMRCRWRLVQLLVDLQVGRRVKRRHVVVVH